MSDVGGPKAGLMNIGEEAKPPFAVLPDPSSVFVVRSERLAALAPKHELEPYLLFLSALTRAQHDIQTDLPAPELPPLDRIGKALEHGMPPLPRVLFEPDDSLLVTLDRLLDRLARVPVPQATADAIAAIRGAPEPERLAMCRSVVRDPAPSQDLARHALLSAGLQVHFVRLAARLHADDLKPVADGACPTCGSGPVASAVVGWPKAHNTRFCTCSLCATMWHVVRIKCVICSATGGITYRSIEGKPDTVKAETCNACRNYVKILYQVTDPSLEPLSDDVASLGLDMLLAEDGWKRGAQNPFLLGY